MARMKSGRFGSARVQQSKPLLPLNMNIQSPQKIEIDEAIVRNIIQDTIKDTEQIKSSTSVPKKEKVQTKKTIKKTNKNVVKQK